MYHLKAQTERMDNGELNATDYDSIETARDSGWGARRGW